MATPHDIPDLDASGLRQFALVTGGILAGLFGLILPWLLDFDYPLWPWIVAGLLAAWGLAAPASLRPVYRGWMRFGLIMNRIVTPLILGILFFLVFTPVAFVMKAIRRDPMARSLDSETNSYRVPSAKAPREKMERPY